MDRPQKRKRIFANTVTVSFGRPRGKACCSGFTLLDLLITMAILGTLAAIATPFYQQYIEKAKITQAIADLRTLETAIGAHLASTNGLPAALSDLPIGAILDPWGNPYEYANYALIPPGQRRKDQFLVPVNSDYDLYSKGKDGNSVPPFTAAASWDDVVRANDGAYLGLASEY